MAVGSACQLSILFRAFREQRNRQILGTFLIITHPSSPLPSFFFAWPLIFPRASSRINLSIPASVRCCISGAHDRLILNTHGAVFALASLKHGRENKLKLLGTNGETWGPYLLVQKKSVNRCMGFHTQTLVSSERTRTCLARKDVGMLSSRCRFVAPKDLVRREAPWAKLNPCSSPVISRRI